MDTRAADGDGEEMDDFDLFRRAFDKNDPDAWEEIARRYLPLIIHWCGHSGREAETLAWETLGDFWIALRRRSVAQDFRHVGGLFSYLRKTALTVKHRYRRRESRELPLETMAPEVSDDLTPLEQSFFWKHVLECLTPPPLTLQERLVVRYAFIQALPPRTLVRAFPSLFPTPHEVNKVRERLLKRLRRRCGPECPLRG